MSRQLLVPSKDPIDDEVLELVSADCWTTFHNIDAISLQFPNL